MAVFALGAGTASTAAFAENPLGFYVGAAVGESTVRSDDYPYGYYGGFDGHHGAFKLTTGVRPISPVGAELEYIDFGNPGAGPNYFSSRSNADANATALFGVGYLPLPLPLLDIYGKVGVARLHANNAYNDGLSQGCNSPFGQGSLGICTSASNRWSTDLAYGAGVQTKFYKWAIRAEYERISATGGDPDVVSVGFTWTF
jgi:opacity protein-like surface antigen